MVNCNGLFDLSTLVLDFSALFAAFFAIFAAFFPILELLVFLAIRCGPPFVVATPWTAPCTS